jgi:hypothetical protein
VDERTVIAQDVLPIKLCVSRGWSIEISVSAGLNSRLLIDERSMMKGLGERSCRVDGRAAASETDKKQARKIIEGCIVAGFFNLIDVLSSMA